MVEKGTLYHLAKLAGIMLGLLAIQEQALSKPDNLILIPAILAAGIVGYYEIKESVAIITAASDDKIYLAVWTIVTSGVLAAAIVVALIRAIRYLPPGGDMMLLSALVAVVLAVLVAIIWNRLKGNESDNE